MKNRTALVVVACVWAAFLPINVSAAASKGAKNEKRTEQRELRQALRKYDKDHNGSIEGAERDALRNGFGAFQSMDTDKDGQLEDEEITVLQAPKGTKAKSRKPGKAGKRKKARQE